MIMMKSYVDDSMNNADLIFFIRKRRAKLKQFSKADQERMLKSWALPANFDATRLLSVSQQGHAADNEPSDRVLGPAQSKALVWRYLNPATLNTIGSSERQIFEPLNLEIHNTASRSKQIAEQDSSSSAAYQSRNANTSHGRSTMVLPGGGISPIKSPGVFTSHDFQTQFIGQRNHNWSSNAPEGHSQDYPSSTIGYSQSASGNPLQIYPHGNPLPLATANHHQTDLTTAPADTVPQSANVWNNTLTQGMFTSLDFDFH
ncbi:hypothetical protein L228DRAFT_135678 [Xylona heveae TC161]|uniref:Uncharacterized protein n=1 Tax=Xylona heveae (strain CBS 132557 / TC161) TaxID=1328760 RepID=A0A165GYX0_XYLHT|nr:hypothetical protein L228DRAFT_135678 [Xylona heveae TC161]KZF22776.1 hypothetical protein L228DRAFT_135678 [Xylona heveae TC161]